MINNKKSFLRVVAGSALMLLVLASCSTGEHATNSNSSALEVSAVTVSDPSLTIRPGDNLRWRREVLWAQGDDLPEDVLKLNRQNLRTLIEKKLIQKGYHFVDKAQDSDYEIVAAAILGDSEAGEFLIRYSKLYPELSDSNEVLEKGTLMLGIVRPNSKTLVWRSAIQAFIVEDISFPERQKRLNRIVDALLQPLP
jgi:hypothetical protein